VVIDVINRYCLDAPANTAKLLMKACTVLRNITLIFDNKAKCGAAGGFEAVSHLLKQYCLDCASHHFNATLLLLLECACRALCNMTADSADNSRCGNAGTIEVVTALIDQYYLNGQAALVMEKACKALCNMTAGNADNSARCVAAGTIEAVTGLIRHHLNRSGYGLVLEACCVIRNITSNNADNSANCAAAGTLEVVGVVRRWDKATPVLVRACLNITEFVGRAACSCL
jgi:hypothetical protein